MTSRAWTHLKSWSWGSITPGLLLTLWGLWVWASTSTGAPLRNLLNAAFTPYNGCMCEDCVEHNLLIPPPNHARYRRDAERTLGAGFLGLLGSAFIAGGIYEPLRRRRAEDRARARWAQCPRCGYARDGLSTGRCPECGAEWR